ncbi:EscU/YscU/HrcU family type III secretion system export apparatus switch protein [Metabacillus iocasae]|uniref:Flagellar biosynthesis protein n=1 Tax=Priestia iocasae TaxID=2291674 RepID=A0ABS2QY85_9BACI|nr:EscU/YscU/HrcU family type III secretion system export apparatus switch protein [Metabacillus iocasae]MBM7704456.1 flagellar biosynthesis protein [Metabacillus iocasae]
MMYQQINQLNRQHQPKKRATVIRYEENADQSPKVLAQATGAAAQQLVEQAQQRDIPVEENMVLLNHLLDLDLGEQVPPQLYAVIAEVLLFIQEIEKEEGDHSLGDSTTTKSIVTERSDG